MGQQIGSTSSMAAALFMVFASLFAMGCIEPKAPSTYTDDQLSAAVEKCAARGCSGVNPAPTCRGEGDRVCHRIMSERWKRSSDVGFESMLAVASWERLREFERFGEADPELEKTPRCQGTFEEVAKREAHDPER